MRPFGAFKILLFIMMIALLSSPVNAVSIVKLENVKNFDVQARPGYSIVQINLNDIPFDGHQTVYLDAYGDTYILEIKGINEGEWKIIGSYTIGGWKHFWVNLTYPNGTTVSYEDRILKPFALDYEVKIQYYWMESDSPLDVDIYFSNLEKFVAYFPIIENLLGFARFNVSEYLIFSEVSGISNREMNVEVYQSTPEEIQDIRNNSIIPAITQRITSGTTFVFTWTWDMILSFVELIPYVGPLISDGLEISGVFITEIFWWFKLFLIDNFPITAIVIEFFIIADAILSTGSLMALVRRIVTNHVAVLNFFRDMVLFMVNLLMGIIRTVASIVNALKPI
jgi:hypothetical protein